MCVPAPCVCVSVPVCVCVCVCMRACGVCVCIHSLSAATQGLGLGALRYNMKDVIATQSILLGDMPNQHLTKTKVGQPVSLPKLVSVCTASNCCPVHLNLQLVYPFRVSVPSGGDWEWELVHMTQV